MSAAGAARSRRRFWPGWEWASIGVHALRRRALQRVAERAQQKGIQIQYQVSDGVPTVRADERRLLQILGNLLDNSVKFTPAGGRVGLEVETHARRTLLSFTVWDTGIGIAAEGRERLFQPFRQMDEQLARTYEGMGLGLTLARRLAALHGSDIQVTSRPGAGSRFTVTLPWTEGDNAPLSAPDTLSLALKAPGVQPHGSRISHSIQTYTSSISGEQPAHAHSGRLAALEHIAQQQ